MRILHLIGSVDPAGGGPIEGILRQAEATALSGTQREIASLDPPDAPWLSAIPMPVHALGQWDIERTRRFRRLLPWSRYGASTKFEQWLNVHGPEFDVIVVNGLWNFTTLGFAHSKARKRVPYVVFTHGMLDPWFRKQYPLKHLFKQFFWLIADGVVVNNAAAVLFTSEDERVLARGSFRPYRARERVIAYGSGDVPPGEERQRQAFIETAPELGDNPYLLFLSRIHEKKGCDLLIEAFVSVAKERPDLHLVMAGPDQMGLVAHLRQQAERAGLGRRVHFTGMLKGDAKWGAFRGTEAFILPSHQENFGIVVAEALACSKPVLISNKVNIWREVEGSGGGIVDDDTMEGTERLVRRFLALGDSERQAMGHAARQCYETHFRSSVAAAQLLEVLQYAIAE